MDLREFVESVPKFGALSHQEKILHLGWYLHVHRQQERFTQADIRSCFDARSMTVPNLSQEFKRLVERRPRVLLQDSGGFRLENGTRQRLEEKYGTHETTIALGQLLRDLPGKISDEAERHFLSEAITCYHHRAFRAAIIMAWNLSYDHLLRWIIKNPARVAAFNAQIINRIGQKRGNVLVMTKREDFEDLKEGEVLDIMGLAGLFTSMNTKKMIEIQLTKRNLAAHPSLVTIDGPAADDTISSLVQNVVLLFT